MDRTEEFGKFQVQFLTGEIAGETDQMGFRVALLAIKSGLRSKVDGGWKIFSIRQVGAAGVNTFGRKALVLGLQIGRGKAQAGPTTRSRAHSAEEGEGSAEHFRRIGKLTRNNGSTNPAATNPLPVKKHRLGIIEENFPVGTPPGEQGDVPRAVFTEPPVWADGDGLERGKRGGQFFEKIRRLLLGTGGIEGQSHG